MGLISDIKNEVAKTGGSKGKIIYLKEDTKRRVRFLVDAEDGFEFVFHDSFAEGINALCLETVGKKCPYCDNENLRTRKQFLWPVWDYDSKSVKFLLYPANSFSPVPAIISMYETYGTLLDRDFVISRTGKAQNTSYTVIPMDKSKFRATKESKVPSEKEIIKILAKAFPVDADDLEDEDDDFEEEEQPKRKNKKNKKRKPEPEPEPEEEDEEDFDEDDEVDYEDLTAKELYKMCKDKEIKCKPKKQKDYYVDLLLEFDDDEEDDDGDEW